MSGLGNVFILGDSYSTFKGMNPKGYRVWYPKDDEKLTDVKKVEETWWHIFQKKCGGRIVRNCSFSGTTVCNTGYGGEDCRDVSFVARLDRLIEKGFFEKNKIDTFIIFGGTNDFWAESPRGEVMLSGWKREDLYRVYPAFGYLFKRAREACPEARIVFVLNHCMRADFEKQLSVCCKRFSVEMIPLEHFDTRSGHPTVLGMKGIADQVTRHFKGATMEKKSLRLPLMVAAFVAILALLAIGFLFAIGFIF